MRTQFASPFDPAAARGLVASFIAICGCGIAPTDNRWGSGEGGAASGSTSVGGSSGSPDGAASSGNTNGDGGLLGMGGDGAGGSSGTTEGQPCSPIGSTRKCCGGTQTCAGSAEFPLWGPCLDATGALATCLPPPCVGTEFHTGCDASTDAGVDSGGTPDAGCGPGMTCRPGKIRYCDVAGTEWTKSECDSTGNWGPCLPAIAPQGAGCVRSSFMPEICCPPLHLCCQDNPGGPWKDWGGGGCAIVSCP